MADENTPTTSSTSTFVSALVVACITVGVCAIGWLVLHGRKKLQGVFQPRVELAAPDKRPEPLPNGTIAYWRTVFKQDDMTVLRLNGPDAYFFVRYLKVFGMMMMVPYLVLTIAGCVPAAVVKPWNPGQSGVNLLTFGNIPDNKSLRRIAHIIVAFALMFFTLWLLLNEYNHYLDVREQWLNSSDRRSLPKSRTVIMVNVPEEYNSEEAIKELASSVSLLPGPTAPRPSGLSNDGIHSSGVTRVWLSYKLKEPEKIWSKRDKNVYKLENGVGKLLKMALKNERKGKTAEKKGLYDSERVGANIADRYVPVKKQPKWRLSFLIGKKVNIETAPDVIREQNEELEALRQKEYPLGNVAFVRFSTPEEAVNFARLARKADKKLFKVRTGIEVLPEDIVWSNIKMSPYERWVRTILSWAATCGIIITWAIPVAFVGIVTNIDAMKKVSWLTWIGKIPDVVLGIIKGVLPAVGMAILLAVLPMILRLLIKQQGEVRNSEISLILFTRFWLFQVIHGFLIVTISSGLIKALSRLSETLHEMPTMLAKNLPSASVYFLTYVLISTWAGAAKTMARLVPMVMWSIRGFLAGGTPRKAFNQTFSMASFDWATTWPPVCLLVVITMCYSVIQPLITVVGFIAMVMLYMSYKYVLIWAMQQPPELETGGRFYIKAMRTVFVGLYIEQVFLAGLFFLSYFTPAGTPRAKIGLAGGVIFVFVGVCTALLQSWIDHYQFKRDVLMYGRMAARGLTSSETNLNDSEKIGGAHDRASLPELHDDEKEVHAFDHPAMWKKQPVVWLADDPLGIGRYECQQINAKGVESSTEFASMTADGTVEVERSPPDEEWNGGI